jgi:membrane fusion protein (multidrug efflux system)
MSTQIERDQRFRQLELEAGREQARAGTNSQNNSTTDQLLEAVEAVEELEPTEPPKKSRKRFLLPAIFAALVALAIGGTVYYVHARHFESTDDAFVEGHIVQIAPRIAGQVAQVLVNDNDHVTKGQTLAVIDSRDFDAKLAEANASLQAAQGRLSESRTSVASLDAQVAKARADVVARQAAADQAQQDANRYQDLPSGAASAQEKSRAESESRTATANLDAAKAALSAAQAQFANGESQVKTAEAEVAQAQTIVQQAELNQSYTTIAAPEAGRVTRKSVEAGAYVQVGQSLLAIVPEEVWVLANFKETQLDDMRPGQPVKIKIDAYPGHEFDGHVDSVQAGTGSRFSLLPPENATGNYVKVVQRVPVKIVFDQKPAGERVLAPGMSVEPSVRVK